MVSAGAISALALVKARGSDDDRPDPTPLMLFDRCKAPETDAEMRKLIDLGAEVVAIGDVTSRDYHPKSHFTAFTFKPARILWSKDDRQLGVVEIAGYGDNLLLTRGRRYLLFLAQPQPERYAGYGVIGGYFGRYEVEGDSVSMSCLAEHDPARASDREPIDDLIAMIRRVAS